MAEPIQGTTGSSSPMRNIEEEIRAFRTLQPGWNSHRAPRISDLAIKSALDVVQVVTRRHAPKPSAAPTPLGGVALSWELGELEIQLLIDEESFDYSVARRSHPKVLDHGSLTSVSEVGKQFVERVLLRTPF